MVTYRHFASEVIKMKELAKGIFYMGLGVGATIAYQKYSKPVMKKIEKSIDKMVKKVDQELDEMM